MKMQGKNLFDEKNDAEHHRVNKKKSENHGKDANINGRNMDELSDGAYYDPQRKENFKLVLGGQKKDSQDQQSKATKHSGLSTDEAAAIVLAATRGASPANTLHKKSPSPDGARHSSKNSGATADEAAAIVMAATRGRSPIAPQKMPRDNSQTSSSGSLHAIKPISKLASNGISGISGSTTQSDKKSYQTTSSDVTVATVIAKTVALAASREADSAEAALTKEQKLKAERLRRAKMFAAVIKSGNNCFGELGNSWSNHSGSMEPSTGGSMQMDTDSKTVGIEREGSSVPFDTEALGRKHESRKRHHSRYRSHHDDSDSDEDQKHSRKKQMVRTSHSSSKEKEASIRRKRYSSPEDERRHRRSSEHRHRRRIHDHSSDDEDREYSELRQRKFRSRSNEKRESEEKDTLKSIDNSERPSSVSTRPDQSAFDGKQNSDATEIPNDLRAKIRAMLLENL